MDQSFASKLREVQIVKKIRAFYRTRKFITVFTQPH
jgi:hypothetical protein